MVPDVDPPPLRAMPPVSMESVPALLNGTDVVFTPAPVVFFTRAPATLSNSEPPVRSEMGASVCTSQVPLLWMAAPEPTRTKPTPVQVVVPAVLSWRDPVKSFDDVPLTLMPPLALVVAAPVIV